MLKKYCVSLFLSSILFASVGLTLTNSSLKNVSQKYRQSVLVEMNVEKSVKSELLGKETKYLGKIYLGKGKFRWENNTPEKTLLVFDGKTIWSEQTPPKEFGGSVQVAKGKVDKRTGSHILISSLMGADLEKNFKVLKEDKKGAQTTLKISPLKEDLTVKALQIVISQEDSTLKEISYSDDIGNLTTLSFSGIKFFNKEKKNLFKYQPPKGAQVTDL